MGPACLHPVPHSLCPPAAVPLPQNGPALVKLGWRGADIAGGPGSGVGLQLLSDLVLARTCLTFVTCIGPTGPLDCAVNIFQETNSGLLAKLGCRHQILGVCMKRWKPKMKNSSCIFGFLFLPAWFEDGCVTPSIQFRKSGPG